MIDRLTGDDFFSESREMLDQVVLEMMLRNSGTDDDESLGLREHLDQLLKESSLSSLMIERVRSVRVVIRNS